MPKVLITAFEPYGGVAGNSSWLCLQELTRDLPQHQRITTRLYPVDFDRVREKLSQDLRGGYDYALHLGQVPGAAAVRLEAFGLNVGSEPDAAGSEFALAADGPAAYRSRLPLAAWADLLRQAGVPAAVSYHAGTYLCNATLYWTHYFAERMNLRTQAAFIHLPLALSQVTASGLVQPSLDSAHAARAIRLMLEQLVQAPAAVA